MSTCVLILSAPRSGSSCLAGCIYLCNEICFGNIIIGANKWNAKGFFEHRKLMWFNKKVIDELGVDWLSPDPLTDAQNKISLKHSKKLGELLAEFDQEEIFAIKLPTNLLLTELYFNVLASKNIKVKTIALHRNQSSKSISHFSSNTTFSESISENQAVLVYKKFEKLLDNVCRIKPHIHIHFEDLINSPIETMQKVSDFIDVPTPNSQKILEFVDKNLVHF